MIVVNFYLKGAISESNLKTLAAAKDASLTDMLKKPLQLYIMVSGLGKRIQIYSKKRITQLEWDKGKQLVDIRKNKVNGSEINEWLLGLKKSILKQCSTNENEGKTTTIDDLNSIIESASPGHKIKTSLTFEDYFNQFISNHKTGDGNSKKRRTVQNYNAFYTHLKNYTLKKRISLDLGNIDKNLLLNFKQYLMDTVKLGDNTVSKYVKTAKTLFRFYMNQGLIEPFQISDVKSVEKEGEIYIINLKQLIQLQNYDLPNERLARCRDLFCFQCWTGQRYSDIENFRIEDIKVNNAGEKVWDFFTKKTGDNIKVPIIEYAEKILEKYANEDAPLPIISLQKQNQNLKQLGKIISEDSDAQKKVEGFDIETKVVEYHDGVRKETYIPFHQLLTTHVARKSYITNSLIIGVPERVVKEVSGHKSEKDFRRYVNLASTYKDEVIRKSYSAENISKYI